MNRHSQIVVHEKESRISLLRKLRRTEKKLICLDEAEQISDIKVILDLAQHSICLILISNNRCFLSHADSKILEKLPREEIEFLRYSDDEIVEILKERADEGLRQDSFDMKSLSTISKICDGDARCAIQVLGIAAAKADELNKDKISIDEIRYVAKCTVQHCLSFLLNKLNTHQKLLYEILKHGKCISSGKLYREYQKSMRETVTDRCYRKYMKGLVKLELAREISSGRWKRFEII